MEGGDSKCEIYVGLGNIYIYILQRMHWPPSLFNSSLTDKSPKYGTKKAGKTKKRSHAFCHAFCHVFL